MVFTYEDGTEPTHTPVQTRVNGPCEPVDALFQGLAFITVFGVAMFSLFMNCVLSCLICIYKMNAGKKRKKVRKMFSSDNPLIMT